MDCFHCQVQNAERSALRITLQETWLFCSPPCFLAWAQEEARVCHFLCSNCHQWYRKHDRHQSGICNHCDATFREQILANMAIVDDLSAALRREPVNGNP